MISSSASRVAPRKLLGLQYLRAVAAMMVLCFHAAGRAGQDFHIGEAGVDLFFVLSGFLMVAITDEGTRPLAFLRDRFARIVPIYWFATSVMLAGALIGLFPNVRLTVWHVVSSFLFVPSRSPSNGMIWPLLVPGWTLNMEMFFYLLFALLLAVPGAAARRVALLMLLLAGLVLLGVFIPSDQPIWLSYTSPMLLEFAGGALLGLLWIDPRPWPKQAGWPLIGAGVVALIALSPLALPRLVTFGLPALAVMAGILCLERDGTGVGRSVALEMAGDASYSIYLWHTLAISVAAKIVAHLGLPVGVQIGANIVAGLVAGLLAFRLLERPILRAFRRRRGRHGVPVPAGV